MQRPEVMDEPGGPGAGIPEAGASRPGPARAPIAVEPQTGGGGCGCGGKAGGAEATSYPYVYAIGRIEPRFPTLGVEKEFAQATGRGDSAGLSDGQALHKVLSKAENRYLARQLCWVLAVGGVETYLLRPRDPADVHLLVGSVRPTPRPTDLDVVIGARGPIAPPQACNGLMVPVVAFDQIYSFDVDSLIRAIPPPERVAAEKFGPMAEEVFWRVMQLADNAGASDEHRALNYLAVRYDAIYARAAEFYGRNFSLTSVDVRPSPLGGTRQVVDVVFAFTHRESDFTEKSSVRVDVTEEFPFLVRKLAPYYDH